MIVWPGYQSVNKIHQGSKVYLLLKIKDIHRVVGVPTLQSKLNI